MAQDRTNIPPSLYQPSPTQHNQPYNQHQSTTIDSPTSTIMHLSPSPPLVVSRSRAMPTNATPCNDPIFHFHENKSPKNDNEPIPLPLPYFFLVPFFLTRPMSHIRESDAMALSFFGAFQARSTGTMNKKPKKKKKKSLQSLARPLKDGSLDSRNQRQKVSSERAGTDMPQPGFEPGTSCLQDKRDNPYAIGATDQSYFGELEVLCFSLANCIR